MRITVDLRDDERRALRDSAYKDRRNLRQQAAILIRRQLALGGYLDAEKERLPESLNVDNGDYSK